MENETELTAEQVHCIRASKISNSALARIYHVSETTISDIRSGRTWKNLPWEPRDLSGPRDPSEPFSRA